MKITKTASEYIDENDIKDAFLNSPMNLSSSVQRSTQEFSTLKNHLEMDKSRFERLVGMGKIDMGNPEMVKTLETIEQWIAKVDVILSALQG